MTSLTNHEVVQPDPKNAVEMDIATVVQTALSGGSIIDSNCEHLHQVIADLEKGSLLQTRPEFRQSLLALIVPKLEQTQVDFTESRRANQSAWDAMRPETPGDLYAEQELSRGAEKNAQKLAEVLRAASQKLLSTASSDLQV
ncbi:MAG: hypothetical protein WC353_01770 [Candidatus Peribacter sp.]